MWQKEANTEGQHKTTMYHTGKFALEFTELHRVRTTQNTTEEKTTKNDGNRIAEVNNLQQTCKATLGIKFPH